MPWGKVGGLAVGVILSYIFLLPTDVLNIQFTATNIPDLLRIFAAAVIIVIAVGIGHLIDAL
jgi:hypothetical protein